MEIEGGFHLVPTRPIAQRVKVDAGVEHPSLFQRSTPGLVPDKSDGRDVGVTLQILADNVYAVIQVADGPHLVLVTKVDLAAVKDLAEHVLFLLASCMSSASVRLVKEPWKHILSNAAGGRRQAKPCSGRGLQE